MIPSLKIPLYGELDSIILHCMVCGELVFDNRYTMDELQKRFDAVRPYKEWPCPHLQFVFAHIPMPPNLSNPTWDYGPLGSIFQLIWLTTSKFFAYKFLSIPIGAN